MKISIFTSMTNPELRNDPWEDSLKCYKEFADEVIVVGDKWPVEFVWNYIGTVFQEGFDQCTGDWVINMPLDYIFHEDDFPKIKKILSSSSSSPAVAFPQHQIFTPDRYYMQSKLCVALNKKHFPQIKMNGGRDLCLPTIENKRIMPSDVQQTKIPIWNYDKVFGTRLTIANDRARFARAWFSQFQEWGVFGGPTPDEAFEAWMNMIKERYKKHVLKLKLSQHPKYMRENLVSLGGDQFGYDAFGLKEQIKHNPTEYLKAYKNKLLQYRYP